MTKNKPNRLEREISEIQVFIKQLPKPRIGRSYSPEELYQQMLYCLGQSTWTKTSQTFTKIGARKVGEDYGYQQLVLS